MISLIALFVALGGGAYAALGPGSVGAPQLKSEAVTTRVLRDGAVTQSKIRQGAIGARQIRAGSVSAGKLAGTFPGTLVAYAKVTLSGVVEKESWRISDRNVSTMPISTYCFVDLPKYRVAMVSPASNGSTLVSAQLDQVQPPEGNCSLVADDAISVDTYSSNETETKRTYEPFYIYLFR